MNILGLSYGYHDSSIAIVKDGKLFFSCAEERLTRQKHDANFPSFSLQYGLNKAGLTLKDFDHVVYHEDPFSKFSRVLCSSLSHYPFAHQEFSHSMKSWMGKKLWTLSDLELRLDSEECAIDYLSHHYSHALQAFLGSGFEHSSILIVDAVGDWACTAFYEGLWENGRPMIKAIQEISFPNSLGLAYSAITAFLGFIPNDSECSTMALAAFGRPRYIEEIRSIIPEDENGLYAVDQNHFNFIRYFKGPVTKKFINFFGSPRDFQRQKLNFDALGEITTRTEEMQRFADIAASAQAVLQERIVAAAQFLKKKTGAENLCYAGGVAMNCCANSALANAGLFKNIYIPPDPGDGGTSVGSALYVNALDGKANAREMRYIPSLGPEESEDKDIAMLDFIRPDRTKPYSASPESKLAKWMKVKKQYFSSEDKLVEFTAELLMQRKIIGWFQGRSEIGPRALGNRSILIRPDCIATAKRLSKYVKNRASYRPYALSFTNEAGAKILSLNLASMQQKKWMQYAIAVSHDYMGKLRAGIHIDGSTRPHICFYEENRRFHSLLSHFGGLFGIDALVNTSFNPSGYPMVTFPSEALAMFYRTDMDVLVLGNWVVWKE